MGKLISLKYSPPVERDPGESTGVWQALLLLQTLAEMSFSLQSGQHESFRDAKIQFQRFSLLLINTRVILSQNQAPTWDVTHRTRSSRLQSAGWLSLQGRATQTPVSTTGAAPQLPASPAACSTMRACRLLLALPSG